jgi:hypothetical protein
MKESRQFKHLIKYRKQFMTIHIYILFYALNKCKSVFQDNTDNLYELNELYEYLKSLLNTDILVNIKKLKKEIM